MVNICKSTIYMGSMQTYEPWLIIKEYEVMHITSVERKN